MNSMLRWWEQIIPEADRRSYERAEFGRKVPIGERPAVLVVDMTRMMFDPAYTLAPADGAFGVAEACSDMVDFARTMDWPIFWCRRGPRDLAVQRGGLDLKYAAAGFPEGADDFVEPLVPGQNESVIQKAKPSAFFETPLRSQLTALGIDTLIVGGMATSGCVRASVIDAFSCNLRVLVVEEATGDRSTFSHSVSLYEMDQKLATVLSLASLKDQAKSA